MTLNYIAVMRKVIGNMTTAASQPKKGSLRTPIFLHTFPIQYTLRVNVNNVILTLSLAQLRMIVWLNRNAADITGGLSMSTYQWKNTKPMYCN